MTGRELRERRETMSLTKAGLAGLIRDTPNAVLRKMSLTQSDRADIIRVKETTVARWEHDGRSIPHWATILLACFEDQVLNNPLHQPTPRSKR